MTVANISTEGCWYLHGNQEDAESISDASERLKRLNPGLQGQKNIAY